MKRCKGSERCPIKNDNICCKECELNRSCEEVCIDIYEFENAECPDEYDDTETGLAAFQRKEVAVIKAVHDLIKQKKQIEEAEKKMREKLVAAMDLYGVKSFSNDLLEVTYVAATTKQNIDIKKLKKEEPEIAKKYITTSPVAASVRIKAKG